MHERIIMLSNSCLFLPVIVVNSFPSTQKKKNLFSCLISTKNRDRNFIESYLSYDLLINMTL